LPPPAQLSAYLPLVKLALIVLDASLETKVKLPPAQLAAVVPGQVMLTVPAGFVTLELI
jgi:hypothetical protein